jgi:hypothetical protein
MKRRLVLSALLLAGCASTHHGTALTADQAKTLALQLANDKAFSLYHCRPFTGGEPAQLVAGHWVWSTRQGLGHGDIEAQIEFAADGSTNQVDCKVLVNIMESRGF